MPRYPVGRVELIQVAQMLILLARHRGKYIVIYCTEGIAYVVVAMYCMRC